MVQERAAAQRSGRAWGLAVAWTLVALAALVWAMSGLHLDSNPTAEAARDNLRQLWPFWIASAATWAGLTAMWMILRRSPPAAGGSREPFWKLATMILLVALGVRAVLLVVHDPALSHDVYRYVFDGRNSAAGYNP